MGLSSWIFGQGVKEVGEGASTALNGVGDLLVKTRVAITGKDPELEKEILQAQVELSKYQNEVNKAEASNPSIFVSGWRPFIGWVCGIALAYNYIGERLILWGCTLAGLTVETPKLDLTDLIALVVGMLGLTAARTIEKSKEVARS